MKIKHKKLIFTTLTILIFILVNLYVYNERIRYEYWEIKDLIFFLTIINGSVASIIGIIYTAIKTNKKINVYERYILERYYMDKRDRRVSHNDMINNILIKVENIEGLANILKVSINNLTTYTGDAIGILDTEGSIHPVGEGLNELSKVIATDLRELRAEVDKYREQLKEEDKTNGKESKSQTK